MNPTLPASENRARSMRRRTGLAAGALATTLALAWACADAAPEAPEEFETSIGTLSGALTSADPPLIAVNFTMPTATGSVPGTSTADIQIRNDLNLMLQFAQPVANQ